MPVVFSTEGLQEKGGQVSLENREDVAPAPAPILQMVARSNTENKATPAPLNSRTLHRGSDRFGTRGIFASAGNPFARRVVRGSLA